MSRKWLAVAAVIAAIVVALAGVERMTSRAPHAEPFVSASPPTDGASLRAWSLPTAADSGEVHSLGDSTLTR
jgi:hypothetical protein